MASSIEIINQLFDQLEGLGDLDYKRMFAEFCVYINRKPIILIIENQIYLKDIPELENILDGYSKEIPYPGLKERYVIDVDDRELLREAVILLDESISVPKARKK